MKLFVHKGRPGVARGVCLNAGSVLTVAVVEDTHTWLTEDARLGTGSSAPLCQEPEIPCDQQVLAWVRREIRRGSSSRLRATLHLLLHPAGELKLMVVNRDVGEF